MRNLEMFDTLSEDFLVDNNYIFVGNASTTQMRQKMRHEFISVIYIAYYRGTLFINDNSIPIKEGDVILINSHTPYFLQSDDKQHSLGWYYCYFYKQTISTEYSTLCSHFENFNKFYHSDEAYILSQDNNNKIRTSFITMLNEMLKRPKAMSVTMKSHLYLILAELLRFSDINDNKQIQKNPNHIVDQIIRMLEYTMYSKTTIPELANVHSVTPEYMCVLFKKHTGLTITQYANKLKIDRIKDLLINTQRPIDMILNLFDLSHVYLRRIFKKATGMSMAEYREYFSNI